MLLTIFVITILCFAVAYKFYGGFQSRFYDLDPNRKTPATELQDDIDSVSYTHLTLPTT